MILYAVTQVTRQLIQPKIVGDSMGVPPLPTLFLLFIGYKFGSVIGMIIAVPLGLLVYSMYQEGAFETTKNSVMILVAGINRFRHLGKEDMFEVEEMEMQNEEAAKAVEKQRREAEQKKLEERERKNSSKKMKKTKRG